MHTLLELKEINPNRVPHSNETHNTYGTNVLNLLVNKKTDGTKDGWSSKLH